MHRFVVRIAILAFLFSLVVARNVGRHTNAGCADQQDDDSSSSSSSNEIPQDTQPIDPASSETENNGGDDSQGSPGSNFRKRRSVKCASSNGDESQQDTDQTNSTTSDNADGGHGSDGNQGSSGANFRKRRSGDNDNDTSSGSNEIPQDDQQTDPSQQDQPGSNFRKRRSTNNAVQLPKQSSHSQETDGSGDDDSTLPESIQTKANLIDSSEDQVNSSKSIDLQSDSPDEEGSGENETTIDAVSSDVNSTEDRIVVLKEKVRQWQKDVDKYLHTVHRRKRRQSNWSQLFPVSTTSNSANAVKGTNSIMSAAGSAVGDALKPAMDLMTQGVDLLGDLYSSQLTRSNSVLSTSNDTAAAEQFRDQLQQLQRKLGDVGQQLQRLVGSFKKMQLPFLDSIFSSGLFPMNAPAQASGNTHVQKVKNDK